jgi:hypothetical protein
MKLHEKVSEWYKLRSVELEPFGSTSGATMPDPTTDIEQVEVPRDQAAAELEAVLRSPYFERSERLQRFLAVRV